MPLITPPARPTIAPNVTGPIAWGPADYVVSTGTTLYGREINAILQGTYSIPYPSITNHGTIWAEGTSANAVFIYFGYSGPVANDGLIVAWATSGNANAVFAGTWLGNSITNSGQIYALSDTGSATAVTDWNFAPLTNSGLIAARAPLGYAQAVFFEYGEPLLNTASGSILAEGAHAVAVTLVPAGPQPGFAYTLDNAGLISAVSTDPKTASIAIYSDPFGSTDGNVTSIHNSGTIRADIAMYLEWQAASGEITSALDHVTNEAGGLIEGAIWLGRGDDVIINRGTINGWVGLGEGNDQFDNALGQINGTLELGDGDDQAIGGGGIERIDAGRGNDTLAGGGGNDLLLGGRGNDTIAGDGGNDGLYGDFGDDLIRTSGGDLAYGGSDQDRIEAGDYSFALIDGGAGFDWLSLPGGGRTLDLSAILASNRLREIEGIALGGGKHLLVRAADITALTGGETQLLLAGDGTDTVELVGGWTAGAASTIGGVSYHAYSLGGMTVQVAASVAVQLSASAASASGLDPVSGGSAAPTIESATDLALSSSTTSGEFIDISGLLQIDSDETWTINNTVYANYSSRLQLFTGDQLINYGQITTTANGTAATFDSLINYGHILAQDGPAAANSGVVGPIEITGLYGWFFNAGRGAIGANGGLENFGTIDVRTGNSGAAGIVESSFINHGNMTVVSTDLLAVGFQFDYGGHAVNSGLISATGAHLAAGAVTYQSTSTIDNSGTITASTTGAGGVAVGLLYSWMSDFGVNVVNNSGTITAPTAIMSHNTDNGVWLNNTGNINGLIQFDAVVSTADGLIGRGGSDRIVNQGLINGDVRLGVGYDRYDGTGGHQTGQILGEAGLDLITGSIDADTINGGDNDDLIFASPGGDSLTGGAGRDTFTYAIVPGAGETITDFVSGTDKLNLSPLNPSAVTITGNGSSRQVHVQSALGNFTINVTGSILASDILLAPGTQNGTTGADALVAVAGGSVLNGGDGMDLLIGLSGNDILDGGTQANDFDVMDGGAGDDIYYVTYNDVVTERASEGYDTIVTRSPGFSFTMPENVEQMIGGSGYGNALDNVMIGSSGEDILDGLGGNDRLYGGAGNDIYFIEGQNDLVFENAGEGIDSIGSRGSLYLYANVENLTLYSTGISVSDDANLFGVGNDLDNQITGNGGSNLLLGGLGNDTLLGSGGNDTLYGEDGADKLFGGSGIDFLSGGNGNDTIEGNTGADALYGGEGDDVLNADTASQGDPYSGAGVGTYYVPDFVTDILVGGAGNDTLYANSGLGDYDLLDGGSGNDTYWVDTGDDLTFEAVGGGIDTVHADVRVANAGVYLYANVENLVLEGTTAFGVGNELDNILTGSASANWLLGGLGADTINGMGGNDVLFGEGGADTFVFGANSGADLIGDFAAGTDRIQLNGIYANFAALQSHFVQNGADGAIDLGGGNLVVLRGVTMANLTAADFIFAPAAEAPVVTDKSAAVMELPDWLTEPLLTDPADLGLQRWGDAMHGQGWGFV